MRRLSMPDLKTAVVASGLLIAACPVSACSSGPSAHDRIVDACQSYVRSAYVQPDARKQADTMRHAVDTARLAAQEDRAFSDIATTLAKINDRLAAGQYRYRNAATAGVAAEAKIVVDGCRDAGLSP